MKLLFCLNCNDVFKLTLGKMRSCECGKVKGRYIDNSNAEVSENAISLAIGNGSLVNAIAEMMHHKKETKNMAEREEYYQEGYGKIDYAWVRPNDGLGNPHCKIILKD